MTGNRPKRLLTIAHSYVLGVNRRLAHELARQSGGKWEVTAVAPRRFVGHKDIRPLEFQPIPGEPIDVRVLEAFWTSQIHLFRYEKKLKQLCRGGFDLIHAWEEPYIRVGFQIARSVPRGVPLVFRSAQSLNKRYPPPFNWIERYCVGRMAGWICSGRLVEQNLLSRPGYADRPHVLAPLGVDPSLFVPSAEAGAATRRQLGWHDPSPPIVGYLGRFVPEKGLDLLMTALDAVGTGWRAVFVGNGPMLPALQSWAGKHSDRVRICTNVRHEEVPAYLNAMDLLAAPSQTTRRWREQFGRMLIEAMACGVPVIGSDSGEIPYVIGDAGVVVGESDVAGWTRAIGELCENPSRRAELAEAGRARVAENYTWPIIATRTLDFFDRLLDERRPGASRP